jgi:hypothetical protein
VRRDSVLVGVATPPPSEAAAAALADRLVAELYASDALIPASPWLSSKRMRAPRATLAEDVATGEQVVTLTPAAGSAVAWWTVQIATDAGWQQRVLPGAQRRVVVAPVGARVRPTVIVTAVDRFGVESAPVSARERHP